MVEDHKSDQITWLTRSNRRNIQTICGILETTKHSDSTAGMERNSITTNLLVICLVSGFALNGYSQDGYGPPIADRFPNVVRLISDAKPFLDDTGRRWQREREKMVYLVFYGKKGLTKLRARQYKKY